MARHLPLRRRSLAPPAPETVPLQLGQLLALMRPHQWLKNAFVAAPLFFTPPALTVEHVVAVLAGIAAFCCLASSIYILNDYMDREADRLHPSKAGRPLAAGTVAVGPAAVLLAALLLSGFGLALALGPTFAAVAAIYVVMNVAYSLALKHVAIIDVLIVALSFVLRVMAGTVLIEVEPSAWILIVSGLLALFIALAKRRDDLVKSLDGRSRRSLDGYSQPFLDNAMMVVLAGVLVAYMIYTADQAVIESLGTPNLVYTVVFVIAGILRYLQIIFVEQRSGSPTELVLSDRFLIATIALWALSVALVIH